MADLITASADIGAIIQKLRNSEDQELRDVALALDQLQQGLYVQDARFRSLGATVPGIAPVSVSADRITTGTLPATRLSLLLPLLAGFTFTSNTPVPGQIAWSTGVLYFAGNVYQITNGSSSNKYVYWSQSSPFIFQTSASYPTLNDSSFLIATNVGGTYDLVWNAPGNQYVTTSHIADDAITDVKVHDLSASKLTAGTIDANVITVINLNASNITTGTLDASVVNVTNLNASNITTGSLSASRISGGTLDAGSITVINLSASSITTGTLSASYISGGTLNCSLITVTNLSASSISTGTLSADRISGGTLDCSLITVTNLSAGSISTGTLSADRISGGTLNCSLITVTNLSASSISTGTLSADRISGGTFNASLLTVSNLSADSITAGTLSVARLNLGQLHVSSLTLTNNSPGAGQVAWSACTVYYNGSSYSITGSNTDKKYIYWDAGNTTFSGADTFTSQAGRFLIATNTSGTSDVAWNKLAASGVQEANLGFSLLTGQQLQPVSSGTYTINTAGGSGDVLLLDTTGDGTHTGGGLLSVGVRINNATDGDAKADLKFKIDDQTATTIQVVDGSNGWRDLAATLASQITGDGTTANDHIMFQLNLGFRSHLQIWMTKTAPSSPPTNDLIVIISILYCTKTS